MAGRARFYVSGVCFDGQSETINITKTMPYNATLLQMTASFGSPLNTSSVLLVQKLSVNGGNFDVQIIETNPTINQNFDIVCMTNVEFRKGDRLRVTYPNTNDVDVGIEFAFREAD